MKYLFLLLTTLILVGCGITGTTSPTAFPPLENPKKLEASIHSVSLYTDESTADNESHGSFNWGSFDDYDKENIQQAILNTVNENTIAAHKSAEIHVKIHRYSQVITNASYASFVIVDWCLENNGELIKDEVFYAGHSNELNIFTGKTLGWAKGETHKAISSRIINQTILALSSSPIKGLYPEDNIFLDVKNAIETLPSQLTSSGGGGLSGAMYYYVRPVTGDTNFDRKSAHQKVDWKNEILKAR